MAFNPMAKKHYFRRRAQAESAKKAADAETQAAERLRAHLRAAAKRSNIIGLQKGMMDISALGLPKQIELLEAYAEILEAEADEFAERWGSDGRRGLTWLRSEKGEVLMEIARLKIALAQGETLPAQGGRR